VMAVIIFNSSKAQKIVFHSVKQNNAVLYLPVGRSHSFVLIIFLFELLRLFNSQFTLFQVINAMHEIGDQTKTKNLLSSFSPTPYRPCSAC